ncbi:hypothetical protein MASR2M78_10860 [Treponema sp.]
MKRLYKIATSKQVFLLAQNLTLSRHIRVNLRGGYHFIGNEETLGIQKNKLSGPELALGLRFLWKTVID